MLKILKVKSRFLVAIIFVFSFYIGQSQHRWENWNRFSIQHQWSTQWSTDAEYQYRIQENLEPGQRGFVNLMQSLRLWTYFTQKKHQIIVVPFSYFNANTLTEPNDLYVMQSQREWRWSMGYQWNAQGNGLSFRYLTDYRFFESNNQALRFRFLMAYGIPITEKLKVKVVEEWMANSHILKNQSESEQNRLGFILRWEPILNLKMETGYLWLHRFHQTATIQENIITFGLQYQLP
ncbi:DUF2490 domain-containing protein [Flavobacterium stagni]|uniref:DUF2490 domain-containing protein n=1 Tax=Flavobacterium stagni TaxID=2506421 RepID=A0A4Q1K829_9FLAO|nr:DUF2490 domain-containing protein [Flavobacterium stagni]